MHDAIIETYDFVERVGNGTHVVPASREMVIGNEALERFIGDAPALLEPHWHEAGRDHDQVPMDVDWVHYARLEREGKVFIVTMREDSALVGYGTWFVTPHPNYKSTLFATANVYYIKPGYRTRWKRALFEAGEDESRKRGCKRIVNRAKSQNHAGELFAEMGYTAIEIAYEKLL